jgi:hypothetical protein
VTNPIELLRQLLLSQGAELDHASFDTAAAYCDQPVEVPMNGLLHEVLKEILQTAIPKLAQIRKDNPNSFAASNSERQQVLAEDLLTILELGQE